MSYQLTVAEQRLTDVAQWFHANKARIPDVQKRQEFLTVAVDGCLLVMAEMLLELQKIRGVAAPALPNLLWTPNGLSTPPERDVG